MQSVHETYIVPTLRFNNIALLMVMHGLAAYTIATR